MGASSYLEKLMGVGFEKKRWLVFLLSALANRTRECDSILVKAKRAMEASLKVVAIGLVALVCVIPGASASPSNGTAISTAIATATGDYSTVSFNASAAQTYLPNDVYTNEELAFLWDQVGPIEIAKVTTVVEPTPEPSPFPQPNWVHPLVPSYVQGLENATLGEDFVWGVASAGKHSMITSSCRILLTLR
jgi:hypothetical protein